MKIKKKCITYAGMENPKSVSEIEIEILGLKNAVAIANELITRYEQVLAIVNFNQERTNEQPAKNAEIEKKGDNER